MYLSRTIVAWNEKVSVSVDSVDMRVHPYSMEQIVKRYKLKAKVLPEPQGPIGRR